MSQKWRRSQQWDRDNFPRWAWPARVLLHAFSSIPLAVVLLSLVVVYATLASVPIGLLALAPTYILYGLTLVGTIALLAVLPVFLGRLALRKAIGRGALFAGTVLGVLVLTALAAEAWHLFIWPSLRYDAGHQTGVRLFAGFCEQYKATTLRRLPGVEMSELEFYGWWPLRLVLLAFITNMVVATVRRIEFTFVNLGVLTVHTGIVMIALGSIYYHRFKLEGDTILMAGETGPDGVPTPGPPQAFFYDNTRVALRVVANHTVDQLQLRGVPRYNEYNLGGGPAKGVLSVIGRAPPTDADNERTLGLGVAPGKKLDPDIQFRVVGYASYADPVLDWVRADSPADGRANPVRFLTLISNLPDEQGQVKPGPVARFYLMPQRPRWRVSENEAFGLEWTQGMGEQRWADLGTPLPEGTLHAVLVEVPGAEWGEGGGYKAVYPVQPGTTVAVGQTGWRLEVKSLHPEPPFPIITEGYRDARSSVAVVRATGPDGKGFDRWLYHRFPEISQDMLDEVNERGMPRRRDADPAIRLTYLDVSKLQVYLDERADGSTRAIVRQPRGQVRTEDGLKTGSVVEDLVPGIGLEIGEYWAHAVGFDRPRVVPEEAREKEDIGNHARAMIAVEVSSGSWSQAVWLPFTRYFGVSTGPDDPSRTVRLPDGRMLVLSFGRLMHQLPGFMVQLVDFSMQSYDHRGAPRDYRSMIRVIPTIRGREGYVHETKLNAPLQAPFEWSESRGWFGNALGTLVSRLSPAQFKFSQAGWDRDGWEQSRAAVDRGQLARPAARFTILGVGNNPGIHVIAAGGILMSVGIPWAFYVKPWVLRRRKKKLQAGIAAGRLVTPQSPGVVSLNGEGHAGRVGVQP